MRLLMELLRMERLYMLMGATMAKKFMMATSVWMDQYIRTERYIPVSYTHLDVYKRQDKWFADATGSVEITDKTSVKIPAPGHTAGTEWKSEMCIRDSCYIVNLCNEFLTFVILHCFA